MIPEAELMTINRHARTDGMTVAENSHKWHEFVYYISCEGELVLNNKTHKIKPGRFVTIPPNVLHSEKHTANGIVFFCIFKTNAHFESEIFTDTPDRTILKICEAIYAEQQRPTPESRDLQSLLMKELLLRIGRWNSKDTPIRDLEYAANRIKMNFSENIKIADIASEIGYGYDYFQHIFKERFGCSPKKYQMNCRIDEAKKLLRSGEYNCTEIAYLCGFSDSAQFSSIFKRHTGISPKSWTET